MLFKATEGHTNLCCNRTIPISDQILKTVLIVHLIFLLAGTSTDILVVVDVAITTAEQIRCSHIIHSTENHCHSLTDSPKN